MKTFLHVGCGPKRKAQTTSGFNKDNWNELRLDIDMTVQPDIVGTMTSMSAVANASVDALYSSHNLEHLYPHEVPLALAEFYRVLKHDGFVVLTCPDLQSVCALIAEDKMLEPMYQSPAGPISPIDIVFGHRPALQQGNHFMAHRCGFTRSVLASVFQQAGFQRTASIRAAPAPDLWIVASKGAISDDHLSRLALDHFPKTLLNG